MSYNESLNSNSNYPVMSQSEWDNAPWNQFGENPPVNVDVIVTYCLSRKCKIPVTNYELIKTSDSEMDEDGHLYSVVSVEPDFSETNLVEEYAKDDADNYSIDNLLKTLELLTNEKLNTLTLIEPKTEEEKLHKKWAIDYYNAILKSTIGWQTDDFNINFE